MTTNNFYSTPGRNMLTTPELDLQNEYEICQRRGHEGGHAWSNTFETWQTCKWCHTDFRMEEVVVERET